VNNADHSYDFVIRAVYGNVFADGVLAENLHRSDIGISGKYRFAYIVIRLRA
jgi:hypothetical protein